jgi:hypothetical protein
MPNTCFSYPADVPPDIGNRSVVRPVPDSKLCFSYQANAVQPPPDSKLCFSYQANAVQPPPDSKLCFSYTVTHRFRY